MSGETDMQRYIPWQMRKIIDQNDRERVLELFTLNSLGVIDLHCNLLDTIGSFIVDDTYGIDEIPIMTKFLRDGDAKQVKSAINYFYKLLYNKSYPKFPKPHALKVIQTALLANGAISVIVNVFIMMISNLIEKKMINDDDDDTYASMCDLAITIGLICYNAPECVKSVLNVIDIPTLLHFLKNVNVLNDNDIRMYIMKILTNIIADDNQNNKCVDILIKNDCFNILINIMSTISSKQSIINGIQCQFACLMYAIYVNNTSSLLLWSQQSKTCIDIICDILNSTHLIDTIERLIWTLQKMMQYHCEDILSAFTSVPFLQCITGLLNIPDHRVRIPVANLMGIMVKNTSKYIDVLLDPNYNVLNRLKDMMESDSNDEIIQAEWTLATILLASRDYIQHIVDVGFVPILVKNISSEVFEIRRGAIVNLAHIAKSETFANVQMIYVEDKIIDKLCNMMHSSILQDSKENIMLQYQEYIWRTLILLVGHVKSMCVDKQINHCAVTIYEFDNGKMVEQLLKFARMLCFNDHHQYDIAYQHIKHLFKDVID